MKQIKPFSEDDDDRNRINLIDADRFWLVEYEDGQLRCSCGRSLIKLDENTFKCTGGYPTYSLADGEVMLDKFGNIMLKNKPHKKED